ncbi:hypothetical protein VitviT2T_017603 [Vitis vinifera]|uniref:EF-hand domain-containing protein n=1 Tax=Vitis vinifera TaxID=29760 RepID=A0ABY9CVF3_VITVI|nr:hypothetical protein VitviT2T_017603 [Vitis vinifera]
MNCLVQIYGAVNMNNLLCLHVWGDLYSSANGLKMSKPLIDNRDGSGPVLSASRLCGNGETAQNQVSAGLGLLTGSTAILLTLLGGCCIIVDKCDPENSREKASEETARGFSLAGSAISTDIRASYTARIMVISVMPFIIVQLAQVLHTSSQICFAIFISLIISVSLLLAYCLHQVFHPSILRRKLAYAKQMHMTSRIVKQLKYSPLERLLTTNGEPDMEVIRMLFKMIDGNSDQLLSTSEIRALITGIQIKDKDSDIDDTVGDIMRDVHACGDAKINIEAFTKGISKWLNKAKNSAVCSSYNHMKTRLVVDHFNLVSNKEHEQLGIQSDEVVKIESPKWSACKAVVMLLLGSLIAATFAGPLVNAVGKFSTATNIPSFFVSFLVLPFASFSEAVSAQNFASQKKLRIASLTFSKIYGAMSMNNFLCMSVFLGLVYFRQLTWNFTSEVLIVLIIWSFLPKEYG